VGGIFAYFTTIAIAQVGPTCSSLEAALNAEGASWIRDNNACHAQCAAIYGDYLCGCNSPSYSIEFRTSPTAARIHVTAATDAYSGGGFYYLIGAWQSCDTLCPTGTKYWEPTNQCVPTVDIFNDKKQPKHGSNMCLGNPIYPMTGTKREVVPTGLVVGGQSLLLTYDTAGQAAGKLWLSSLHHSLEVKAPLLNINADRGDGRVVSFEFKNGIYTAGADTNDTLVTVAGGYLFTDAAAKTIEAYNSTGQPVGLADAYGNTLSFTLSDASTPAAIAPAPDYLIEVTDNTGRSIKFEYTLTSGANAATDAHIARIIDTRSQAIAVAYDAVGNLVRLTWADGKTKTFVYENASFPWALTGVFDENNSRYSTFGYNATGQAISTEHAGGVDKYTVTYSVPPTPSVREVYDAAANVIYLYHEWQIYSPSFTVTPPSAADSVATMNTSLGYPLLAGTTQPAGSGCAASNNASTFDTQGNILSQDDFKGQRTCYAYDSSSRETVRIEGLANTVDCTTVTPAGATLAAGARKITTQWHPDWRIPSVVTAPGSIATSIYQGQSDPFNANATANCTGAAALPDGKPLPMMCKSVVQATTATGALDASVPKVVSQFSYSAAGRILSSIDSLNHMTRYAYYADTSFTGVDPDAVGHTVDDLQSVTNAAGHVTQFTQYDKAGRIVQTIDPKGVVTDIAYTPRGWIASTTLTPPGATARTTRYNYDGVGQIIGISTPDGDNLTYSYDAAHRLIGATDAKGNSVEYTLDNVGNRIDEQIKGPTGTLQRTISRSFDALNRLQQVTGAAQ
jgi:YD repeat-containing protein